MNARRSCDFAPKSPTNGSEKEAASSECLASVASFTSSPMTNTIKEEELEEEAPKVSSYISKPSRAQEVRGSSECLIRLVRDNKSSKWSE